MPTEDFRKLAGDSANVKTQNNRGGTIRGNASVMRRTVSSAPPEAPMAMTGNFAVATI
jgi:hypothetical protein